MFCGRAAVDGTVRANEFHQTCRGNGDGKHAKLTSSNTGSPSGDRCSRSTGNSRETTPPWLRTSLWKAQAAQDVLKARVSAKGIQLGVGGDPRRAVRALVEGFSQP